jgi:hypothetical protein
VPRPAAQAKAGLSLANELLHGSLPEAKCDIYGRRQDGFETFAAKRLGLLWRYSPDICEETFRRTGAKLAAIGKTQGGYLLGYRRDIARRGVAITKASDSRTN